MIWYDPGRDAADRLPDWVIRHRPGLGVPEVMCTRRKVILIEQDADPIEQRCNLAHAVAHVDLKHSGTTGLLSTKQELAADCLAARRLVALPALIRVWFAAESVAEVAAHLDVTERMLRLRLRNLRKAERDEVGEILNDKIWAA